MINIDNKKVHDLIVDKDILVNQGRKISRNIEMLEIKIKRLEDKEKGITGRIIPPKELTDKGDEIAKQIEKLSGELDKIARSINNSKLLSISEDIKKDHMQLLKDKEILERERNKIALKVQKIKDKIIPVIQREVKPILRKERIVQIDIGKYDDIGTAKTKDNKIVIETFNHLEEFMTRFQK